MMKPQIEAHAYFSSRYLLPQRMAAYAYQFREITELKAPSVLEVGVGNGLLSWLLRHAGVNLTTLDFDASLKPDIVAKVTAMPLEAGSFSVAACYEVLEHLPFEDVPAALRELRRVAGEHVLISLPDARRCGRLYLPGVGKRKFLFENPFFHPGRPRFPGGTLLGDQHARTLS